MSSCGDPSRPSVTWTTLGPWAWVTVAGDLTDGSLETLHATLLRISDHDREIAIDLSRVSSATAALAHALLDTAGECNRHDTSCTVVVASDPCRQVLARLRADQLRLLGIGSIGSIG